MFRHKCTWDNWEKLWPIKSKHFHHRIMFSPSVLQTLSAPVLTSLLGLWTDEQQHIVRFIRHNFVYFFIVKFTVCSLIKLSVVGANSLAERRLWRGEIDVVVVRWRVESEVKRELRCLSYNRCLREKKNLCILNRLYNNFHFHIITFQDEA